eukprot:TRINITY_DN41342_c0_g1_i1.p1 TRINITY_DN41342_c0_g1~~TRINITY_DN41342_c0_g1_i1.p1  ORF type:complete len:266 (+),score=37.55 TRINITY_DN41342_c0_g1_i1:75-872(+)
MAGVQLLFLDGGATVAGSAIAGAAALGYKRHQRDDRELANEDELHQLRQALEGAHASVSAGHTALTAAWRSPLSLFREQDETNAVRVGVPLAAIAAVRKAQRLVDKASEFEDLAEVYDMQLKIAEDDWRCVVRAPVLALICYLESLSVDITRHVQAVILARDAFDAPGAEGACSELPPTECADQVVDSSAHLASSQDYDDAGLKSESDELPISILRGRSRLGELWGAASAAGISYGEALGRALARRGEPSEPPPAELSSYALAYM